MTWVKIEPETDIWKPDINNSILEGVIIDIAIGQFGKQLTIERKDGAQLTTPAHKQLQSFFSELKVGERLRIEFKEARPTKKGSPMMVYDVYRWVEIE